MREREREREMGEKEREHEGEREGERKGGGGESTLPFAFDSLSEQFQFLFDGLGIIAVTAGTNFTKVSSTVIVDGKS